MMDDATLGRIFAANSGLFFEGTSSSPQMLKHGPRFDHVDLRLQQSAALQQQRRRLGGGFGGGYHGGFHGGGFRGGFGGAGQGFRRC
jgi:hypothetical protein